MAGSIFKPSTPTSGEKLCRSAKDCKGMAIVQNDFSRHFEHRLSVLKGFLDCPREPEFRNVYNAAIDGAIVTCRSLWELMGVIVDSRKETAPHAPSVRLKAEKNPPPKQVGNLTITQFTETDLDQLQQSRGQLYDDLRRVLVAGNKCVAHMDEFPDHGVEHSVLERATKFTLSEVPRRVPNLKLNR